MDVFITSLGSTWLGFSVNALFAIGTVAVTLYWVRRKRGVTAMVMRWKDEMRVTFYVGISLAAILYVPLIIFALGKAMYQDHENLVQISKGQRAAISRISSDPLIPTIHEVRVPVDEKNRRNFLFLANKVIVPAVISVHCDGPLDELEGSILESRMMLARPAWRVPNSNDWMFEIDAPAWTPASPMLITYKYPGPVQPKCGFEAKEQK